MDLNLTNKHVVISGATGEIGRQICLDFALEGAFNIPLYRSEKKKNALIDWLKKQGVSSKNLSPFHVDLMDKSSIVKLVKEIVSKHKTIDILVNCAGYAIEMPFLMLEEEEIATQIQINYTAPMLLMKEVLKPMFINKGGSIINISSATAHSFGRGVSVYGSAKAGLDRFTKIIAQEVGRKKIRVNSVCPGVIATQMSQDLINRGKDNIKEFTALKKYGSPEDVAKAVLFLASDETAKFITGHVLQVDGGIFL